MIKKYNLFDFTFDWNNQGKIVKEDDRYLVRDYDLLEHLAISSTKLHPGKITSGHSHDDQDEIYFFLSGQGSMRVGDEMVDINAGNELAEQIVLVPAGKFHQVENTGVHDLFFVCVFNGKRTV